MSVPEGLIHLAFRGTSAFTEGWVLLVNKVSLCNSISSVLKGQWKPEFYTWEFSSSIMCCSQIIRCWIFCFPRLPAFRISLGTMMSSSRVDQKSSAMHRTTSLWMRMVMQSWLQFFLVWRSILMCKWVEHKSIQCSENNFKWQTQACLSQKWGKNIPQRY